MRRGRRAFFWALLGAGAVTAGARGITVGASERPLLSMTVLCPRCGSHLPWPSHEVASANPGWQTRGIVTNCATWCGWRGFVRFYQEQT